MDQPPPTPADPSSATAAEQAAARLVAAEESARRQAWRAASRSSTSVARPGRGVRVLLPLLIAVVVVLALGCALLVHRLSELEAAAVASARRASHATPAKPTPRVVPAPAATPAASPEPLPPAVTTAPPSPSPAGPPPAPLVVTIPVSGPATAPAGAPTATEAVVAAPPSPEERRQLQLYEQRLVTGTDMLARDLAEREQAVARTARRLTFEPTRQPPLGAVEELAEAIRHWEGAVGEERERLAPAVHNRRAEVANLQRQLAHDQEVAESLRKRLEAARQELDGVRKKLGPPP